MNIGFDFLAIKIFDLKVCTDGTECYLSVVAFGDDMLLFLVAFSGLRHSIARNEDAYQILGYTLVRGTEPGSTRLVFALALFLQPKFPSFSV